MEFAESGGVVGRSGSQLARRARLKGNKKVYLWSVSTPRLLEGCRKWLLCDVTVCRVLEG
jgi:polysaccharide pyruvyl transferase WcaK-like protein